MEVKIKIRETSGGFEPLIYACGRWRSFGVPYKAARCEFSKYLTKKAAKRGAENVAGSLGIKLKWEGK